jgi:hypothetical protein
VFPRTIIPKWGKNGMVKKLTNKFNWKVLKSLVNWNNKGKEKKNHKIQMVHTHKSKMVDTYANI